MSATVTDVDRARPGEMERVLGEVRGPRPGPTLVCVGSLHGNEPAGVRALLRVLPVLEGRRRKLSGEFVALAGNLRALREGRRFLVRDLNRAWSRERVEALRSVGARPEVAEDREQLELLDALDRVVARARGSVHVLDLHTTSGQGGPFSTVSDTLRNRSFAQRVPAPMILGLEELVEGTLLEYLDDLGHVTLGFEAGQHDDPRSVDRAEAAVWIAVEAAGLVPAERLAEAERARERLRRDTADLPRVFEMRHRHPVGPEDGFRMRPGYLNFQPIDKGEVLGRDRGGEVRSPEDARILMPLYQSQGEDGFFVVREFRPFWLSVSRMLRRAGVPSVVHWLPGISRVSGHEDALVVDRRIARWFALELLHLLGFRRHLDDGRSLVVIRRPER